MAQARRATFAALGLFAAFAAALEGRSETFRVAIPGAVVVVTAGPGPLPVPRETIEAWIRNAARAIVAVFGRFGVPEAQLDLQTGGGGRVHGGRTDDFVPHVSVALGTLTTAENLSTDWVLTHEFVHLATPTLRRRDAWFMEGAATYLEPLARARVGLLDADALWQGLLEGLPAGLPRADDTGLDGTRAWGRKYWGGALYFLLADLEIRERSGGRRSLDDAFRGILAEGGDVRANWTLEEALAAGDRGVGGGWNVLSRLHAAQGPTAVPPDLDALFRRFGVSRAGGRVVFDDSAPLAAVRRALTTGAREKGDAPAKKAP